MKFLTVPVTTLLFVLSLSANIGHAADHETSHVATLAGILVGMEHFPSDAEKKRLTSIADDADTDEHVRTIARAITRIAHQVPEDDKQKLKAILDDESATEAQKTLAGAVIRFNHEVSSEDRAALEALAR